MRRPSDRATWPLPAGPMRQADPTRLDSTDVRPSRLLRPGRVLPRVGLGLYRWSENVTHRPRLDSTDDMLDFTDGEHIPTMKNQSLAGVIPWTLSIQASTRY